MPLEQFLTKYLDHQSVKCFKAKLLIVPGCKAAAEQSEFQ